MAVQVAMAYAVRDASWWKVLVAAYVVSGTASQNLFTAQHELSHFLAFRKPLYNKILSLASNCPLVVPMATSFRKYHQEHHSHLVGIFTSVFDMDYPASWVQCCIKLHAFCMKRSRLVSVPECVQHTRLHWQCHAPAFIMVCASVRICSQDVFSSCRAQGCMGSAGCGWLGC